MCSDDRHRWSSHTFPDELNARSLSMLVEAGGVEALRYWRAAAARLGKLPVFIEHHCSGTLLDSNTESQTYGDVLPVTECASLTSGPICCWLLSLGWETQYASSWQAEGQIHRMISRLHPPAVT